MENESALGNVATSAIRDITEDPEDREFNKCGERQIIQNLIKDFEGLGVEICVEVKPESKIKCKPKEVTRLVLKEEFPHLFTPSYIERTLSMENSTSDEQIEKLERRFQMLAESYKLLVAKAQLKVNYLKSLYDPDEYSIYFTKTSQTTIQKVFEAEQNIFKSAIAYPIKKKILKEYHLRSDENSKNKEETELDKVKLGITDHFSKNKKDLKLDEAMKRNLCYLQPETAEKCNANEYPMCDKNLLGFLIIGPNGTRIKQKDYESLQLKNPTTATRFLCDLIFGEDILVSHSLTGNQSPAFRGRERPRKKPLDPLKVADITHYVCSKFNTDPKLVRLTITVKCGDAAKRLRRLLGKPK